jgi:LysM repeat protein
MRVSVVAGLIVGVHVAVIGSVMMTQGCASTRSGADSTTPAMVEPAPMPVLPPSADLAAQPVPVQPVAFPQIQPPAEPAPLKTSVAAGNIYVVKSGDSLSKIAAAHGVNTRELAELNQITDANKIRANQKLVLPDHAKPSQSQPSEKSAAAPAKASASAPAATVSGDAYVVKAGDALSKIAALHGVKTKDLMAANNITDANKIRVGQKLVIPGAKASASAPEAKPAEAAKVEEAPAAAPVAAPAAEAPAAAPAPDPNQEAMLDYTVQDGDTAEGIARLFVVRKDDILRVNNVPAGADVQPGQKIKIPPSSL